jgi:APA family basic amino acid/polyamine antiporter
MSLFATKPLSLLQADADKAALKRALGPWQLIALGIGAIIGAGIFTLTGVAAATKAGPAVTISFVACAFGCAFAGICYSEFSTMIPIAGSAYTYSYATMGELLAWIIGWDLVLEYAVGAATVSIGWSSTLISILHDFGIELPPSLIASPWQPVVLPSGETVYGIINLPAVLIVILISLLLVRGIQESARTNAVIVALKVAVVVLFIVLGWAYIDKANYTPYIPPNIGPGQFGWSGILSGAGMVFFAFIGFDAVSTAAQEARNPQKDMPIGMIGSLAICTVLYVATSLVLTGMVPIEQIRGSSEPLAKAFSLLGMNWAAGIVAFGAVIATTAVLLVFQYGQARIFFSMARDGLLPKSFAKIHPKYKTPHVTTIWIGVAVALLSAFANLDVFVELTNIGTLFAFVLVCVGIIILRYKDPDRNRPFRVPFGPIFPVLGIL